MLNNLKNKIIILASASPRRSFLLSELNIDHQVKKYDFDESIPQHISAIKSAEYIAIKKNDQITKKSPNHIYISSDTTVVINNRVLGKPKDHNEAKNMIKSFSGTTHQVITGVCISSLEKTISFDSISDVTFNNLTSEEIDFYVEKYSPLDKAGAYGIQEWIGMMGISHITGSYYNIMGLPTEKVFEALKQF